MGSELVALVSDAGPGMGLSRAGLPGQQQQRSAGRAMETKGSLWVTSVPCRSHSTIPPHTVTMPCALSCFPPALFPGGDLKGLPLLSRD